MGKGKDFREPRRRGFDDDNFSPPQRGFRPPPQFGSPRYESAPSGPVTTAIVKWFNAEKGFGFVEIADGGGDAFLHIGALERAGHSAVSPGATLQVRIGQGQKGPQVAEVVEVDESTASAQPPRRAGGSFGGPRSAPQGRAPLGDAVPMDGTVKWFNPEKGFGFVTPDTGGKDVFVHVSALQRSGVAALAEGQRVAMEVAEGRKGPEAVSIRPAG